MPTLVMIHGLFGHLAVPEIHEAIEGFDVHAPDLIGYGTQRHSDTSTLTLREQANHVIAFLETLDDKPVHLLGHSVGGAVACLVAHQRPDLLRSLISVEGNFTLKDAFWSAQIVQKIDSEVEQIIDEYRSDPAHWMAGAVDKPTRLTTRLAHEWLEHQPASTIKAQARAVVQATGDESYLLQLRRVMESTLPVHLIAGARSAADWDVPDWAHAHCASNHIIPDTGHLMMAEDPRAFAAALIAGLRGAGS